MENIELKEKALSVPDQARTLTIVDVASYQQAGEVLLRIKDLRKEIDSAFDPIIEKAHQAHKEACAQKKKYDAPLVEAEGIIKPRIAVYLQAEEQKRRVEQDRLQQEEETRRLNELARMEANGQGGVAKEMLNEATFAAPVIAPKITPKIDGISQREVWKFKITNSTLIPREYLIPDLVRIGAVVRASRGVVSIPGVTVYKESTIAAGR